MSEHVTDEERLHKLLNTTAFIELNNADCEYFQITVVGKVVTIIASNEGFLEYRIEDE